MCVHTAHEAGGVLYLRGSPAEPAGESNTCSNAESADPDRTTEAERMTR